MSGAEEALEFLRREVEIAKTLVERTDDPEHAIARAIFEERRFIFEVALKALELLDDEPPARLN
jgi:hypothetical protein